MCLTNLVHVPISKLTRTQAAKEMALKVKRERQDDNPRPRKAARPSAGASQLEIDDDGDFQESSTAPWGFVEHEIIEID